MNSKNKPLKLLLIAPVPSWQGIFQAALESHNRDALETYGDLEFELLYMTKDDYANYDEFQVPDGVDVLIARGVGSASLRQRVEIPVVQIHLSYHTLERAIQRVVSAYPVHKLAVVGHNYSMFHFDALEHDFGLPIAVYNIRDEATVGSDRIEEMVDAAIAQGCDGFICGHRVLDVVRARGRNGVFLDLNFEEAWHAVGEAKHSAYVYHYQKLRTQFYKNILDYSFEGIVSFDQDLQIRTYNQAAARILLGDERYRRHDADKLLAQELKKSGISKLASDGIPCIDSLLSYDNRHLSINSIPTMDGSTLESTTVMMQDVTRIQRLEQQIRDKIHARGHMAKYEFTQIQGESPALLDTIEIAKQYARAQSNILIQGETGTGKEVFAQSIHNESPRKNGPFVAVNCAALSESLLESELFGYVDGAFTGAVKGGKPGYFELAHTGTIFLDEISEMPLQVQGKLLRAIQEREIVRLGSDKVTPIDVRILSATNKDLEQMMQRKEFREDLYFRLDVLHIQLPSLQQRAQDIPQLAENFFKLYMQINQRTLLVDDSAYARLQQLPWPGNVRQLRNVCERIVIVTRGDVITADEVARAMSLQRADSPALAPAPAPVPTADLAQAQKHCILQALRQANGNKEVAARSLGMSRATFYRHLKKLDISSQLLQS